MKKSETGKNWLSKDRIYQPSKRGGLNCIELNDFLHAIRLNWMHRYLSLNYNDFWTSLLDKLLIVNPATRPSILEWGSEEFNNPIIRCNNRFLKPILMSMKLLCEKFQTPQNQETRDSFINSSSGIEIYKSNGRANWDVFWRKVLVTIG